MKIRKYSLFFILQMVFISCGYVITFRDSEEGWWDIPSENTTGPTSEITETSDGFYVTTPGTVIENIQINGTLWITVDNVTIRNFIIDPSFEGYYGIRIDEGCSNIVIQDGEIRNVVSSAILGSGFTLKRVNMYNSTADAVKVNNTGLPVIIESCYIHHLGIAEDAHADGIQMAEGGSNVILRSNNFYMPSPASDNYPGEPYKANAAIFLPAGVDSILVEGNYLTGGGFTIYSCDGVSFLNNYFGEDYMYGIFTGTYSKWENNKIIETNEIFIP